jgi:hypothetical protein
MPNRGGALPAGITSESCMCIPMHAHMYVYIRTMCVLYRVSLVKHVCIYIYIHNDLYILVNMSTYKNEQHKHIPKKTVPVKNP